MRLRQWAKQKGLHYKTAWTWFRDGKIPGAYRYEGTGAIFVRDDPPDIPEASKTPDRAVIYCRVSNHSRKTELDYQVKRCVDFCFSAGIPVYRIYKEVASGMNENRREMWKMFDDRPTTVIIENKDRLTRFGFQYLKAFLERSGGKIVVINETHEDSQDLVKDLTSVIYSFCARLYGMRRAKNRADKIKELIKTE